MQRLILDTYLQQILPGTLLGLILYVAVLPLRRRRLAGKGLSSPAGREWLMLILWCYGGAMAMLTLMPPGFQLAALLRGELTQPFFAAGTYNFKFFATMQYTRELAVGNVVLFMPFPFLAAVLWRREKWYQALLLAVSITVFIECWQHFVGRMTELDDLLLNTAGGMLGWLLWRVLGRPALRCKER